MKKYCLVGKNLSYSYSKIIHEYLINKFRIDATYDLIEVQQINKELLTKYDGLTITIPYKEAVLEFVDENTTDLPANTILNSEGYFTAYNTDILGFGAMVDSLNNKDINKIVILGSGSSSKMVQEYFNDKEVLVISRTDPQLNYDYLDKLSADLLVNTTPVGMNEYNSPINKKLLSNYKSVLDLNYNPINSKLAMECKENNVEFKNGLIMLIKQAAEAFKIWHGIEVSNKILQDVYAHVLLHTQTKIALVGMPLSGKTSLINKFGGYDLDREIQNLSNKTILELLSDDTFREREHETLKRATENNEKLIATGGGIVLRHDNMLLLKDYLVIYLDVPLQELLIRLSDNSRPLLKTSEDLENTYKKRKKLYLKYSNLTMNNDELLSFLETNQELGKVK